MKINNMLWYKMCSVFFQCKFTRIMITICFVIWRNLFFLHTQKRIFQKYSSWPNRRNWKIVFVFFSISLHHHINIGKSNIFAPFRAKFSPKLASTTEKQKKWQVVNKSRKKNSPFHFRLFAFSRMPFHIKPGKQF